MVLLQNTVQSTRYLYAGDNDRLIKLKQDKASYEKDYSGPSLKVERRGFSEKMGSFFFSFFVVDFSHLACLVCLLQGEDEGLKSGKMSNELENPKNPHHANLGDAWVDQPSSLQDR